jgi:hypothetical protein
MPDPNKATAKSENEAEQPAELPGFVTPPPKGMKESIATFCKWYALTHNGSLAFERAGRSSRNPGTQASKMRKREDVRAYIAALEAELDNGRAFLNVSAEFVTQRYMAIAGVSITDLTYRDAVTGARCWRQPEDLTPIQRAAIKTIQITKPKAGKDEPLLPAEISGYELYPATDALAALARIAGLNKDTVKHDHAHTVKGKVQGLFRFVAGREATSETTARLRARHGNAGARIIDHEPQDATAEPRALARLRGV